MIPLWGVNVTQNKKNEIANGRELIVATVAKKIDIQEVQDRAEDLEAKASLPLVWRIIQWVCGLAALIVAIGFMRGAAKVGVEQAFENAPALIWIFAACLIVYIVLKIWGNRRNHAVMTSGEVQQFDADVQEVVGAAYEELGVPEDAVRLDAFVFRYKEKDGKINVRSMGFFDFINVEVRAYVKGGDLCFADTESVYALPLTSLKGIQTVKKTALFHGWNKELPPTDKSFKPYRVAVNQYESIYCKPYHILEAEIGGQTWGVYFPGYELPAYEALTGLQASEKGE